MMNPTEDGSDGERSRPVGGFDEDWLSWLRVARRAGGGARLGPGSGADDPLGPPEQHRSPRQLWRAEICRSAGRQERWQAEDPRIPGLPTRQRDAAAIRRAR